MITTFQKFKLITENPDTVPLGGYNALHYYDADAIPFYVNVNSDHTKVKDIFLGEKSGLHSSIDRNYKGKLDERSYKGRLWLKSKIISFWIYPSEILFVSFIEKLEEKLNKKMFNNGWKINIMKLDNDDINREKFDPEKNKDFFDTTTNGKEDIIPIEDYAGSENVPEEIRALHLMSWREKELAKKAGKLNIKGWGSEKTAWDSPYNIKFRQKIYQEKNNKV